MDAALGERLLVPGAPLFEYWGHEACWMPLALYPLLEFRRQRFRERWHRAHGLPDFRKSADALLRRARDEGPFRSADLDGPTGKGWWQTEKTAKWVAESLWCTGDLAIRERRGFQRVYDLPERVIPDELRTRTVPVQDAYRALILLALDGHGWAEARTIAATWRLRPTTAEFRAALQSLADERAVVPCSVADRGGVARRGWMRPRDLAAAEGLRRLRPRADRGVLLSPFDPVLWDRTRLQRVFDFDLKIEIYTPAPKRKYGYYCMPVLAGDRLVARVDVKADRAAGVVRAVAVHYEPGAGRGRGGAADREAVRTAIERHARGIGLGVGGRPPR